MNEMYDNREEYDYRNEGYRGGGSNRGGNNRGESNRGGGYRDYMDEDDFRESNRRGGNRRGRGRSNRGYRNYRDEEYYEELENCMYELKEYARSLEDLADMAEEPQERNMIMKIAQKQKEHYNLLKQMLEK